MEPTLMRRRPAETTAAAPVRAEQHRRSVEAEARELLADDTEHEPATLVDLLGSSESADCEFEPERLGLTARTPDW